MQWVSLQQEAFLMALQPMHDLWAEIQNAHRRRTVTGTDQKYKQVFNTCKQRLKLCPLSTNFLPHSTRIVGGRTLSFVDSQSGHITV